MAKENVKNKNKDKFVHVMVAQTVVCFILIGLIVFSVRSDGSFGSMMKNGLSHLMTRDFTAQDISETFEYVKNYVFAWSENRNDGNNQNGAVHNVDAAVVNASVDERESENEVNSSVGGIDIDFTNIDALEGICFDKYKFNLSFSEPLDNYEITSGFGYRISPMTGEAGIHTGLDMATDYGMQIHATADGTVADAGFDSSYGNYVKIIHTDNIVTIYAHCSHLAVSSGDTVKQGDVIAYVGSTGASTGNHLHFEMRKDNIRINPEYALFGK